jgi:hypothetical protein
MSGVGLEVLLEGLVPEIAYSGEKGASLVLAYSRFKRAVFGGHASGFYFYFGFPFLRGSVTAVADMMVFSWVMVMGFLDGS